MYTDSVGSSEVNFTVNLWLVTLRMFHDSLLEHGYVICWYCCFESRYNNLECSDCIHLQTRALAFWPRHSENINERIDKV